MMWLHDLIGPDNGDATALQLCFRAVLLFGFGLLCVRLAGRRTFAQATPLDIVVAMIVGSNLSRAMTGKAPFWPSLAATLILVLLHRLVAMATLRQGWLAKIFKPKATVLVRDGAEDRAAMRRHGVSEADLLEAIRMEQMTALHDVALATLEGGGKISVVPRQKADA